MKYALIGNPNCGKTSLFNRLTGSRAKVANLPGVTVDPIMARLKPKKVGAQIVDLIDLPGTYSLHPKALDEAVTRDALLNPNHTYRPDGLIVVMDAANLKRNLYLTLQVLDLGLPAVVVVNETAPTSWSREALESALGCPVLPVHALNGKGTKKLEGMLAEGLAPASGGHAVGTDQKGWRSRVDLSALSEAVPGIGAAGLELLVTSDDLPAWMGASGHAALQAVRQDTGCGAAELQLGEAAHRSRQVREIATTTLKQNPPTSRSISARIDRVLTHRVAGPLILTAIFFLIFQAVYAWATWPMDLIDAGMGWLMGACRSALPAGWWTDLLVDGLLSGLGGVVIFVPQIALLFGAIAALEESGYMTRVAFMNDRWLRSLGLDGRSAIPLLGGFACSIPAILGARTIPGKRERLLTILITPWMTCSARLPVYLFLIGFVVPSQPWGPAGAFNLQGMFLFGIYIAGLLAGLVLAWILHKGFPKAAPTQFLQEWPPYRVPSLKRTLEQVWMQARAFVEGAGKVIVMVSIISVGTIKHRSRGLRGDRCRIPNPCVRTRTIRRCPCSCRTGRARLAGGPHGRVSWSGRLGLHRTRHCAAGLRWPNGGCPDCLLCRPRSLCGHHGHVVCSTGQRRGHRSAQAGVWPRRSTRSTGQPILGAATAMSLIVFYMLAMQCISTIAIVGRNWEAGIWRLCKPWA